MSSCPGEWQREPEPQAGRVEDTVMGEKWDWDKAGSINR